MSILQGVVMNFRKILVALILVSIFAGLAQAVTISSVFNLNSYYAPGEYMKPFVKAVDDDGTPAEQSEGYSGRYILINSYGKTVSEGSLNYDRGDGYWKNGFNAPYEEGTYTIVAYVESSRDAAKGSTEFRVGAKEVTGGTTQTPPSNVECKEEVRDNCRRKVCTDGYQGEWICEQQQTCKEEKNEKGCYRKICSDGYQGEWICPKASCKQEWNEKKCYREICNDGYEGPWACPTVEPQPVPHEEFEQCLYYYTPGHEGAQGTAYGYRTEPDDYTVPGYPEECYTKQCCYRNERCKVYYDDQGRTRWDCPDGSYKIFKRGKIIVERLECKKTELSVTTVKGGKCFKKTCNDGTEETICMGNENLIKCDDSTECKGRGKEIPPVKECECKTWKDDYCVYAQCPGQEVQKICCPRGECPEKEPRPHECDEKEYVYAKRKCYDNGGTPMYTEVNGCPQIECVFEKKEYCPSDEEYAAYKEKMVQECQQSGMEYYGYQDEMGCNKIACIEGKERKCPPIERMDEKIANCKQEGKEIVYKDARGCQVPVCVPVEKVRNRATEKECADIVAKIEKIEKTLVKLMDKIDRLMSYYAQKGNDAKVEELNSTRVNVESMINSIEQGLPDFKKRCSTEYSEEELARMREEIAKFIQVQLEEIKKSLK